VPRLDETGTSRTLIPIEGLPPDMTRVRPGCPFAPRCAWAIDRCIEEDPPLAPVDSSANVVLAGANATHRAACWNQPTDEEARAGVPASGRVSAISALQAARAEAAAELLKGQSQ
jgi:hypothetical protein